MRTKQEIQADIAEQKEYLEALKAQRLAITTGGATEWETRDGDSTRRVKNLSLDQIRVEIDRTNAELKDLYAELDGYAGIAFSVSPMFPRY
jgi:hypothetical protein